MSVYLAFNPAGLALGTYTFTIFVNTSDPSASRHDAADYVQRRLSPPRPHRACRW